MVDIYEINTFNKSRFVTSINEKDFFLLSNIFLEYKEKTGYIIDEYSDLIIKPNNIEILLKLLNKSDDVRIKKYYKILKSIKDKNFSVGFYGD